MRLTALFPLACAIIGFVLSLLCLLAGHKPGFMEDYAIVTLNTSTLGHELIPTTTSSGAQPTATGFFSGIWHNITTEVGNLTAEIEGELDGIIGDVADKLAAELGIKQWYSLHILDFCEGTYAPNATEKGAHKNGTKCSNQTAMYHFDLTEILNKELEAGKLHINLSDINWPDDIQNGLNHLSTALDAEFVVYCIGIASAGLAIFTSLVAIFLHGSRLVSFGNFGLASMSFLTLMIASIIVTVVQNKSTHLINKYGNEIGIYAYRGTKYLVITWVATAVMFLAMVSWIAEFCIGRRNRGREYTEKKGGGRGFFGGGRVTGDAYTRRRGV